jgi:WD40 repeat protein/DNA-binding SARP family transcriptional activator
MEFRLLGPLEVSGDGRMLSIGGPKQRAVLAHLLLRANEVVSVDRLIDAIWGDEPPETARNTLQTYVRHLRKALGAARVQHRPPGYVLVADPAEVDVLRFVDLVDRARGLVATDPVAAVEALREALGLWRGPALDDLAGHVSLQPEIARIEALRMAALEERVGAELDLERQATLIPELEMLVGEHPLRERLLGHLMTALYRSGRQADALAAYRRASELLREELGINPSPGLQHLHQRILRQDPALEITERPLRGYRLLEPLGAGSFGSVHRAFQPQVGREVAIKTIHPRFANDPEFIRRFEAEAQLVARLEHPHVVSVYDFWREPDGAYLVMRYLRGGSLKARLVDGPLPPEGAARMVDQLALALDAAHRQGVIHRDVQPGNVLFDEDDNAYLSDFGIARDLATAEVVTGAGSSPVAYYLSPEEILGAKATPSTDVYGLGVVLFEALAGRHPFADATPEELLGKHLREPFPPIGALRRQLPGGLQEVIARATAKDPAERYPEAPALASALRHALAEAPRPLPGLGAGARNPYKGLRPFQEADASDFFGRERLVARLLARMADDAEGARFLAVVGPSGSGKSSLVAAGLIPALRDGALPGSQRWFVVQVHPGARVFDELAAALVRLAVGPVPDLMERLENEDGLLLAAEAVLPQEGAEILVVIDQFEEVFTLVSDEAVRARFLTALAVAATDPRSRMRIVVTLRADFYDRPLAYQRFGDLLATRTEALTPLSVEELARAISGPAERVGVRTDPPLLADIVSEVADQQGALPLLQYALTELFENRGDGNLTLRAYREVGGFSGALARRAEDLYGRAGQAGKYAIQQLFLRLITLGHEGSEDSRRRVLRAELRSLEVDAVAMESAIDYFGARRLLSFDRDPVTRGPTVEVAHEALLREWGRLRGWVEGARDDVRAHRRLAAAAAEWTEAGRDPSFLLRGDRLVRFEVRAASSELAITRDERAYLEASLAQRATERAEEESRTAREAALARRSVLRLRALVALFAALALVAAGLTTFTVIQREHTQHEARLATARELAAAAVANLDVDPERSILLALEAVRITRDADGTVVREAEEALHRAIARSRLVLTVPQGGGLAVSPDGTRFGTTGQDGTATVWAMDGGRRVLALTGHDGAVNDIAFAPDGSRLATTGADGTVRVWDGNSGAQIYVLHGHQGAAWSGVFSPDGTRLATTGDDATVRIWDVSAGTQERVLTVPATTFGLFSPVSPAFSPDGTRLASPQGDGTATIWDLATGRAAMVLTGHDWQVTDIAFSPDGRRVATASLDGTARIWDAVSGQQLTTLSGHTGDVHAVDYSSDGGRVSTGGSDATARIWDARSGEWLMSLAGHTGEIDEVAFSPDGDRLLTASKDGTTRLWDISVAGGRDWLTVAGPSLRYGGVAFSPAGSTFAIPGDLAGVTIRDVDDGATLLALKGNDATIATMAFSPDGSRLAAAAGTGATKREANRTVPIWDTSSGELVMTLTGHDDEVSAVAFSPDGRRLVTSSWDGTLRVWDAATGAELRVLDVGGDAYNLTFSPDGRFVLTSVGPSGTVTVWDADTFTRTAELRGHAGYVQSIAVSREGRAVTGSVDGTARIWDLESRRELATLRGHTGPINSVAVSPGGALVATAGADGMAKLWDAATGREVLTVFGHEKIVHTVAFSPDGRLLATASVDGTVALHLLPIDELRKLASQRVTRSLTNQECRQYLHLEACLA